MSESRVRNKQIKVYVTEREREELRRKARKCGIRVSDLVRDALIYSDDLKIVVIDFKRLHRAWLEVHRQGVNLNQIARALNSRGAEGYDRRALDRALELQRDATLRMMSALISLRDEAARHHVVIDVEPLDPGDDEG